MSNTETRDKLMGLQVVPAEISGVISGLITDNDYELYDGFMGDGKRRLLPIDIHIELDGLNTSDRVRYFIPESQIDSGKLSPTSALSKVMVMTGSKTLSDLIGKHVKTGLNLKNYRVITGTV